VRIRNENVSCDTCKHKPAPKKKYCGKCINQDGHPGWEPAPGVKVRETRGYTFTAKGTPIETIFRTVVNSEKEGK